MHISKISFQIRRNRCEEGRDWPLLCPLWLWFMTKVLSGCPEGLFLLHPGIGRKVQSLMHCSAQSARCFKLAESAASYKTDEERLRSRTKCWEKMCRRAQRREREEPTLLLNGCLLALTWIMCLFINWEREGFYHPFVVRYTLAAL